MHSDTQKMLDRLRHNVVMNVKQETQHLINQLDEHTKQALDGILSSIHKSIKSLEALNRSGVLDVYASREDAAPDIARDLTLRTNRKVRLIGISLNDFFLRNDPFLGAAWRTMQDYIEKGVGPDSQLDLRILIIDPICFGAQLRSRGEERAPSRFAGRLKHDVDAAIEALLGLQAAPGVTFECRLYRLPPGLFLCWTDTVCYVQQYYFWASRVDNKSFPILKFLNVQDSSGVRSIHEELEMHFNWIWDKATIGLQAYWREYSRGADKGIAQAGVVNVFTSPNDGLMRMLCLLSSARQKVSIQGISLHSFFNRNDPKLYQVVSSLLLEDKVDLEVLFLDPDCDQAKFRALREYSFDGVTIEHQQYFSEINGSHQASTLHRETTAAKSVLEGMVREIASRKPTDWKPKLKAGYYDSAPYAFLLRVDDAVLSEQYHHGKLPDDLHGA